MAYPLTSAPLTIGRAINFADPETKEYLTRLQECIASVEGEMQNFRQAAQRVDALYYPNDVTKWGPDTWADDPSATAAGRAHISVNQSQVYVNIPAALQAVEPIENMVATDTTPESRTAAERLERVYVAWKRDVEYELFFHKACTLKGLYGRTAARYYWDPKKKRPCVEIIERPQRLFLGYSADTYNELDWAAFVQRMTPAAVRKAYKVAVTSKNFGGLDVPVVGDTIGDYGDRSWLSPMFADNQRIEVWDFWFRDFDNDNKLVVKNIVLAGNRIVRGPEVYDEYDGLIPYLPLFNNYVPNVPNGASDLYYVEHLIREHQEKLTNGSQMISSATAGDYWQLVGPDAPMRVPPTLQPRRNEIAAPGPGNRIEALQPFIAQFQLDAFLKRLDYDKETITGLNDLLLGHIPASALNSSRAVNAFVAQYELRMRMSRLMLYSWRRQLWERVLDIWTKHDDDVKEIVASGGGVLDIQAPNLSPRDELDTATKAANLVNANLWSARRGMDAVGVDDPETEQQMIREEQTDATLNPAKVQVMAQLLATLQQLQIPVPGDVQGAASAQAGSAQSDLRNALGAATPNNNEGMQAPGETGQLPPGALQPGATPPGQPFAQGPAPTSQLQTMVQNGRASGRILSQTQLGRKP